MDLEGLNSPRRELSNSGLKSVVTLLVRWQINFLSARIGRPIQLYSTAEEAAVERDALRVGLDGVNEVFAATRDAEATELEGLRGEPNVAQRRAKEVEETAKEAAAEGNAPRASLDGVNEVLAATLDAEATEPEGLLAKRDVAQRRAEKAEEVAEEAAAERDALRAFLDAGKIPFPFVLFTICIVLFCVQQRSKNLKLIKLNKDSDRRVRRLEEQLNISQAGDDLMISLERFQGN